MKKSNKNQNQNNATVTNSTNNKKGESTMKNTIQNQNQTANTTNATKNKNEGKNKITLSKFGVFIKMYAEGVGYNISKKSLVENAHLTQEQAESLTSFVERFYTDIAAMMDLRQEIGKTENVNIKLDLLRTAEQKVKDDSDAWFLEIGTRPAKKNSNGLRPAYGTTYSDYAILGECVGQAIMKAGDEIQKIPAYFFEILVLNTARMLNGVKMGRITDVEFNKAKAELNRVKAEKAAESKVKNAQAKAKKEAAIAEKEAVTEAITEENETLKAEIEALKAITLDTTALIAKITQLTAENLETQKKELINFITETAVKSEAAETTSEKVA